MDMINPELVTAILNPEFAVAVLSNMKENDHALVAVFGLFGVWIIHIIIVSRRKVLIKMIESLPKNQRNDAIEKHKLNEKKSYRIATIVVLCFTMVLLAVIGFEGHKAYKKAYADLYGSSGGSIGSEGRNNQPTSHIPPKSPISEALPSKPIQTKAEPTQYLPIQPEPKKSEEINIGSLEILTDPENAKVEILNTQISYQKGMYLETGKYNLRVSAKDYHTKEKLINISKGENFIKFELEPVINDSVQNCIESLKSSDPRKKKNGAQIAFKKYNQNPEILTIVEKELSKGHKKDHINRDDKNHIEAMRYLCLILGTSKSVKYKSILMKVNYYAYNSDVKNAATEALRIIENKKP